MSDGLNLVTLFGNLGAEPELKTSAAGPVLKMRLATDYSWRNKESNEREKRTEWHSLTMFGPRAEALAKHLHKGSRVMVTGHLRTSSYEKEGQTHHRTEVIVDELCFGSGRSPANGAFTPAPREAPLAAAGIPF
ncbi:MAG: single-stranded DNA-binding protein [Labilithrix sp.]|nr:single-stranded DNA-binding protein [Labilithrix sp.]MCW5832192.1 single-stranded DNA-binding protein [Labilithrix sp.]